jgi:hypothetical protein
LFGGWHIGEVRSPFHWRNLARLVKRQHRWKHSSSFIPTLFFFNKTTRFIAHLVGSIGCWRPENGRERRRSHGFCRYYLLISLIRSVFKLTSCVCRETLYDALPLSVDCKIEIRVPHCFGRKITQRVQGVQPPVRPPIDHDKLKILKNTT